MRGPLASLATAEVLEDRTLVVRPEDANVRHALADYVRDVGRAGASPSPGTALRGLRRGRCSS